MKIVTAGESYLDIDAFGGMIAYAELLQAQGHDAAAVSTAVLNESISKAVRGWNAPLITAYTPNPENTFSLIDVSDPEYFAKFVDLNRIDTVVDHRPGMVEYWYERIGDNAVIDLIGAACTLIYEKWNEEGLLYEMSPLSAKLLATGILDNTLNFGAHITTERDYYAYDALMARADLPKDWPAQYFSECQESIVQNPAAALRADSKVLTFNIFGRPVCAGQTAVWDGRKVLDQHRQVFTDTLKSIQDDWFLNLISIGEQKSYFVTDNTEVQAGLQKLLNIEFKGDTAIADRLWLRKEIIQADLAARR